MHDVANAILMHKLEEDLSDVPLALQHGSTKHPLGRYLRQKLRGMIGRDEKCPEEVLQMEREKLQPMRENAFFHSQSFQSAILDANKGKRATLLAKYKIRQSRKTLT